MDPNVAKMIEKSRSRSSAKKASRMAEPRTGKLSPRKIDIVPEERRSPLKPKNFDGLRTAGSPKKKIVEIPDSPSDTIKRILSRESLETNVKDLLARLVSFYTSHILNRPILYIYNVYLTSFSDRESK